MIYVGEKMTEIITKTYELIDALEESELIKNIKGSKKKLLNNKVVLDLVDSYNIESDDKKKIIIKKKLYEIEDYVNYMHGYNELALIILKINHQYGIYTKTKEHL